MNLNYDILRVFAVVARSPSFAAAAKQLFVTVSAISQQMKTLEAQLGYALFERVGRRARLTEAGRRLAADIHDPLVAIDEAIARALESETQLRGTLIIGAPRGIAVRYLLPRLLPKLPAEVRLRLVFDLPSALERLLVNGELDVCLLVRPPEVDVAAAALMQETFVAAASPAYLKKYGRPRTHAEFSTHRYAIFDRDYAMHGPWWRAAFGPKAKPARNIVCEAPSLEALLEIAAAGVAIAVLPKYFLDKRVVALEVGRAAVNTIYLCSRRHSPPTAKHRWALRTIADMG